MAKNSAYRWRNLRVDTKGTSIVSKGPKKKRKARPAKITNAQARYLAVLCKRLGKPYNGDGMTKMQAMHEISRLKARCEARGL